MHRKYKLGVTYSLFSGEELLRKSILSIREQVDYINVVYQRYSWIGQEANEDVEQILKDLVKEGLINNIIKFEFRYTESAKLVSILQCKKRNIGLRDLAKSGCSHAMLMDVDEFYCAEEFKRAKEFIYKNKITHSVCSIYDYRVLPIYRMKNARDYCVSFIFKLNPVFSRVMGISNMPCRIDVFRTIPYIPLFHKFYYLNMVNMHHMTGIRNDYKFKVNNSISNLSIEGRRAVEHYLALQNTMEKMNEEEILNAGYIKVEDDFGIMKL